MNESIDASATGETAREAVLRRLRCSERPLAIHEFQIIGHSENAIATRISTLSQAGIIVGSYRKGFKFKEWSIARPGELPLALSASMERQ